MRRHLLALALAALLPAAAAADSPDTRLREALRSATSQLRALEDEKTRWQQREAELQKEMAEVKGQLAAARKSVGAGGDREAPRKLAAAAEAQARLAEQLGACQTAGRQAEEAARAADAERARASSGAADLAQRLAASEARNRRLYLVGREIIDWLRAVGVGDALAAREPFLGFRRVALENEVQALDDKLRDQRSTP